jgi:hypothetical protein
LTLGGYALLDPVECQEGRWVSCAQRREEIITAGTSPEKSLLPDSDFHTDPASAGWQPFPPQLARWISDFGFRISDCADSGKSAIRNSQFAIRNGSGCLYVHVPAKGGNGSAHWQFELREFPREALVARGKMKTQEITGWGSAYLTVHELDDQGHLVTYHDFAIVRGTTDWQGYRLAFTPRQETKVLRCAAGIFEATGRAWYDDFALCAAPAPVYLNTSGGELGDGLNVSLSQLGLFDLSAPLRRAAALRASAGQTLFPENLHVAGPFRGWIATGLEGPKLGRWTSLLTAEDRLGRPCGSAAALLHHHGGFFRGSTWAYFGVENKDLFTEGGEGFRAGLKRLIDRLQSGLYLHSLATPYASYRPGEAAEWSVAVDNTSGEDHSVEVELFVVRHDSAVLPTDDAGKRIDHQVLRATVPAGETRRFVVPPSGGSGHALTGTLQAAGGFVEMQSRLRWNGEVVDQMEAGFVVRDPARMKAGHPLRFAENTLRLGEQSLLLLGCDTWGAEDTTPLRWRREMQVLRDFGLRLYELLQACPADYRYREEQWRRFDALVQLAQECGAVYMGGLIIGGNVACDDETFARQQALCRSFARRYASVPGLLHYVNGDIVFNRSDEKAATALWNQFLAEKYGSVRSPAVRWLPQQAEGTRGEVLLPPEAGSGWDDMREADRQQFEAWCTRRWMNAMQSALKEADPAHPVTAEYYPAPLYHVDPRAGVGDLEVANCSIWDPPDQMPHRFAFNDHRATGQGLSVGEFGLRPHPAWAANYELEDPQAWLDDQAEQRFGALVHYGLGFGACKLHNWCLRDALERPFPWGIFLANEMTPRPVAYTFRNLALLTRWLQPKYEPPAVTVLVATNHRLGQEGGQVAEGLHACFDTLTDLHVPFNVLDEEDLDDLPAATRFLLYPLPYCPSDEVVARLEQFCRRGGQLYFSGDLSYDEFRRANREERLERLAGVRLVERLYPHIAYRSSASQTIRQNGAPGWPGLSLQAASPDTAVLLNYTTGNPALVQHRLGAGRVTFLNDPAELRFAGASSGVLRSLYAFILRKMGVEQPKIEPDSPDLHFFSVPLADGRAYVLRARRGPMKAHWPTFVVRHDSAVSTLTGQWALDLGARSNGLVQVGREGRVLAVETQGAVTLDGERIIVVEGSAAAVSLDGADLRQSRAVLWLPFAPGQVTLLSHRRWRKPCAYVGEFVDRRWRTWERVELRPGSQLSVPLDADRATCLIVLTDAEDPAPWAEALLGAERETG